jgi:acyl-coenzyme A synthetase/AMP-(fatty) acid ligase
VSEPFQTVAAAFVSATLRFPQREAVVSADGRRYRYADVREEVAGYVAMLQGLGCQAGDRVAVWLSNRPEWVFA